VAVSAGDGDGDLRSSAGRRESDTLVWRLNAIAKLLEIPPFISAERSERGRRQDHLGSCVLISPASQTHCPAARVNSSKHRSLEKKEREREREREINYINLILLQRYESHAIHPSGTRFSSIKPHVLRRNFSCVDRSGGTTASLGFFDTRTLRSQTLFVLRGERS